MKQIMKRLLSGLLVLMMVIGLMPTNMMSKVNAASDTGTAGMKIYVDASKVVSSEGFYWDSYTTISATISQNDGGTQNVVLTAVANKEHWYSFTLTEDSWQIYLYRTKNTDNNATIRVDARAAFEDNVLEITGWNSVKWTGDTYTESSSGGNSTEYFYVDTMLVDYYNDNRVGKDDSSSNRYNNQGLWTGSTNLPYSNLNSWISGLSGYANNGVTDSSNANAPVPLYFGDLLVQSQTLIWYWKGANVAFGPNLNTANNVSAQGIVGNNLVNEQLVTSYSANGSSNGAASKVPFFEHDTTAFPNQDEYMKFYDNLQFPFTITTDGEMTEYSFNSEVNTVYYDYTSGKLVRNDSLAIYDYSEQSGDDVHGAQGSRGYFPFNSSNEASNLNFGFGTKFTIPFTLDPSGVDANGDAVKFEFTGDDDVWVYIDGALVLDMGGAHNKASGYIDFKDQVAVVSTKAASAKQDNVLSSGTGRSNNNGSVSEVDFEDITVLLDGNKTTDLASYMKQSGTVHTLTMYYMERGMWNSNMSISFTFNPVPSGLILSKEVNTTAVNEGLAAEMKVKDTFDFTVTQDGSPVSNINYKKEYDGAGSVNAKTTSAGVVEDLADNIYAYNFTDSDGDSEFDLGDVLTVTESVDTSKYTTRWYIWDQDANTYATDAKGNAYKGENSTTTGEFSLGQASDDPLAPGVDYVVNFVNTPKVGSVEFTKTWGTGTAPTNTSFEFLVEVDLDGDGTAYDYQPYDLEYSIGATAGTAEDGVFTAKVDEKVVFPCIPVGAKLRVTETATAGDDWAVDGSSSVVATIENASTCYYISIQNKSTKTAISYGFYLVDENGAIVKDQQTGETTTDFSEKIEVTDEISVSLDLGTVKDLIASTLASADGVLPDECELFDPATGVSIKITTGTNGEWTITTGEGVALTTTYVTYTDANGVEHSTTLDSANVNDETYTDITIWFAVKYYVVEVEPDVVVIDFGLPVEIDVLSNDTFVNDDNKSLNGVAKGNRVPTDNYKTADSRVDCSNSLEATGEEHGDVTISNGKVKYTPTNMTMNSEEVFTYEVKYAGRDLKNETEQDQYYYSTVTVIPATTIYYEDDFLSYKVYEKVEGTWTESTTETWTTVYDNGKTSATVATQAEDRPGLDSANVYGYDGAYTSSSQYSLGSARMINVKDGKYGTATFTFYGTGFDVVSLTSSTSGTILVDVFAGTDTSETPQESYMVDTYYGYRYGDSDEDGDKEWYVDTSADGALYQVPVMKVSDLDYGQYTVVITASYSSFFDHGQYTDQDGKSLANYDFYLDAIRIYDPAEDGKNSTTVQKAYKDDGEGWPTYYELRNLLIDANTFNSLGEEENTVPGIIFIDGNKALNDGSASADDVVEGKTHAVSDYANYGPNNELYLAKGQAIAFDLSMTGNIAGIHLAYKSVGGTAAAKIYGISNNSDYCDTSGTKVEDINKMQGTPVATATDLYYDITALNNKTVVITNTGDDILSVTNIKVTYNSDPSTEVETASAFSLRRSTAEVALASLEKEEEIVVFTPEQLEVSVNKSDVKVGSTVKVTVTTADDVESISVNGEVVDTYKTNKKTGERTWTVKVTAETEGDMIISVVAYDAEGTASEAVEETVTVTAKKSETATKPNNNKDNNKNHNNKNNKNSFGSWR